jgi:hypothetical protein
MKQRPTNRRQRHQRRDADPRHRRHDHGDQAALFPHPARRNGRDQRWQAQHEEDIRDIGTDNIAESETGTVRQSCVERHDHLRRGGAEADNKNARDERRNPHPGSKGHSSADQRVSRQCHDHEAPDEGSDQRELRDGQA